MSFLPSRSMGNLPKIYVQITQWENKHAPEYVLRVTLFIYASLTFLKHPVFTFPFWAIQGQANRRFLNVLSFSNNYWLKTKSLNLYITLWRTTPLHV